MKRGGDFQRSDLADFPPITLPFENLDELLELDGALDRLAKLDPTKAELVKLLHFAGMNLEEAASLQGLSRSTAYRHWQFARAWLREAIAGKHKNE